MKQGLTKSKLARIATCRLLGHTVFNRMVWQETESRSPLEMIELWCFDCDRILARYLARRPKQKENDD